MAYKQYTSCVQPGDHVDFGTDTAGIINVVAMIITFGPAVFIGIILLGGQWLVALTIALVTLGITFLNWYLYGRLVCLGEDERNCAIIGMVYDAGPSDPREKYGDDDYTMNMWLANIGGEDGPPKDPDKAPINQEEDDYWKPPQGHLVKPNQATLPFGYIQDDPGHLKLLHCEFEGSGIYDLLHELYALLPLLVAAVLSPFPANVIIALVALLLAIFYAVATRGAEPGAAGSGNPLDVIDEGLVDGDLVRGQIVVVKGEWIYDSGHEGWNEIHPVRHCCIIYRGKGKDERTKWGDYVFNDPTTGDKLTLETEENVVRIRNYWCDALKDAELAEENGSRDNPELDWKVHPTIDGCRKPIVVD